MKPNNDEDDEDDDERKGRRGGEEQRGEATWARDDGEYLVHRLREGHSRAPYNYAPAHRSRKSLLPPSGVWVGGDMKWAILWKNAVPWR